MTNPDKTSYPTPASGKEGLVYSFLFGLFVTFFLWFFQPFNINIKGYTHYNLTFFGIISFIVFSVAHTVMPLIQPNIYKESKWTIYSQIIFYLILTFFIATFNGLYINYLNDLHFSWSNYRLIIIQTLAVGIIPISLSVLISYLLKYKRIAEQSNIINQSLQEKPHTTNQQYSIQSNIKDESFIIKDEHFLFAKSSGNYIEIHSKGNKPALYRMSLSDLESQLSDQEHLMRCHRSYLVNTQQVNNVTGNAQGLKLWMGDEQNFAPVSRNYLAKVRNILAD